MHTTQRQISRALAAGALSVALLSAGSAGAFATEAKPTPSPTTSAKPKPSPSPTTTASISARADTTSVKTGDSVTVTGRTSGLKVGWPLVLQHQKGGKWIPLKATAKVKNGSSYSLTTKLSNPGTEHLRVAAVGKKVYSPTVTVKVS
ncbi:hypothetical protein [Streptomyces sp. Ag109_O5-10]|uniref:hypothetical protein n=1 Tax=Streptomyces sp. Ag109_O5-10 TaxID=1855349 RepID=UPI00089551DD|nr:hypothetical protein [Streptomyces sp. Ag109_O5-10]SEF06874.1 hypothetical protein SAMN05216533_5833 [Streptomyces sp. Ag109_O5-10]